MTTTPRPQSELVPLNVQPSFEGRVKPVVYSDAGLAAKNIKPVKTAWGLEDGKPILWRLPGISEQYRKEFPGVIDLGYVYIDPRKNWAKGPGTLEVGTWAEDPSILTVQSGTITWVYGQKNLEAFAVDISTLNQGNGLQDGEYQVGYLLEQGIPEVDEASLTGYSLFKVEDYSLADAAILTDVSTWDTESPDYNLVASNTGSWQPNQYAKAGPYYPGTHIDISFRAEVEVESFTLTAADKAKATAPMATYWSDDLILWYKENEVRPNEGVWKSVISTDIKHEYWKLFWWDGFVNVETLNYTGEAYYPIVRPSSPITLAEPYIDDLYEDIAQPHAFLAHFTVENGVITGVVDNREVTYRKYEPVAGWLTSAQDDNLKKLFGYVENYASQFMAPPTSCYPLYDELTDNYTFELGNELLVPRLIYPQTLQLEEDITPFRVVNLQAPSEDGDLSNKVETDEILNASWSVDNGIY